MSIDSTRKKLLLSLTLCLSPLIAGAPAYAAPFKLLPPAEVQSILANNELHNNARALLGNEYPRFIANFEHLAASSVLKNGGVRIEGWKENQHLRQTSSMVIQPGGSIHAAYFAEEINTIRYFNNDPGVALHPSIAVWLKQFDPSVKLVHVKTEAATAHLGSDDKGGIKSEPNAAQQGELRKVAAIIWNQNLANGWTMNGAVGDLLSEASAEILDCAAPFVAVPPPANFVPGWPYLASNQAAVVQYFTAVKQHRVYRTCVSSAASNYRTAVELASAEG